MSEIKTLVPERVIRKMFEDRIAKETSSEDELEKWLTRSGKTGYYYPVINTRWNDFLCAFRKGESLNVNQIV